MSPSFYLELENQDDFKTITETSTVCVVDLYTTWCGPCKALAPKLENAVKDDKNLSHLVSSDKNNLSGKLTFLKVDVDKFPEIAEQFKLSSIPLIHFFKNGKLHEEKITGANLQGIMTIVKKLTESLKHNTGDDANNTDEN